MFTELCEPIQYKRLVLLHDQERKGDVAAVSHERKAMKQSGLSSRP